jgi:hypothetical protein
MAKAVVVTVVVVVPATHFVLTIRSLFFSCFSFSCFSSSSSLDSIDHSSGIHFVRPTHGPSQIQQSNRSRAIEI